ncbi:hypothetical protein OU994_30650 [Pseudoduganella sp. SL102]|uniref:hypothetical protein n=1 Tax=Pseudoduganella sp. SL102 TaxID=2995154 RepID=UPI00248C284D|nr:hypothetical protein [Pseudoduganella sp. SL102]WBS02549.1 hypothetical protein OU994_30650 [Pseudoduganella sp. SL102]
MTKRLLFTNESTDPFEARIGGGALIGGVAEWPVAPDGTLLMLVASIPNTFLAQHTGVRLSSGMFTSVFSYYSEADYFLDQINYHGHPEELAVIDSGTTRVIQHPAGQEICQPYAIAAYRMDTGEAVTDDADCGSRIGGKPTFLQNEEMDLDGFNYILQLSSSDFPSRHADIFGLSDAVAYLYLPDTKDVEGKFFSQVT